MKPKNQIAVGWKDPTPNYKKLKSTQRILSLGLRQSWAPTVSFWIDVYARNLDNKQKPTMYYVHRQWSFVRSKDGQLIEGDTLDDSTLTHLEPVVSRLKVLLSKKQETNWEIKDAKIMAGSDEAHNMAVALGLVEGPTTSISTPPQKTTKDQFRETLLERQKNAKW